LLVTFRNVCNKTQQVLEIIIWLFHVAPIFHFVSATLCALALITQKKNRHSQTVIKRRNFVSAASRESFSSENQRIVPNESEQTPGFSHTNIFLYVR